MFSSVLTEPPIVMVTLEHAGRIWRMSSEPVSVTDDDGVSHLYRGGLSPMDVFSEAIPFGESSLQSQTFEVLLDDDVALLTSEQHLTSEATAEIAQYVRGSLFSARDVRLSGRVKIEADGFLGKPIRMTVTADDPASGPASYPPADAKAWNDTCGTPGLFMRQAEDGRPYPTVFGQAGTVVEGGTVASVTAVPVIPVLFERAQLVRQTPWGLVDQWWIWPGLTTPLPYGIVSQGWLYPGPTGSANQGIVKGFAIASGSTVVPAATDCTLVHAYDLLGRKVTLVDGLVTWDTVNLDEDFSYYVAISPPCSGIARMDYQGGLTGAGQIIRWALELASTRVDWRRAGPALAALDRYELAGFWDQPMDPWQWLVDNVLPLLPCSWVAGPRGIYPVLWRLDATQYNADARPLIDGLNCTIDGPVAYDGDPMSAHTLDFAKALFTSTFRRSARWHGQPTTDTTRESGCLHLRRAQQRYGSRVGAEFKALERIENTDLVYSDRTADRVIGWWSVSGSEPQRPFRIVGDGLYHRSHVSQLEPGMSVPVTSDRYSLSSRVAHVVRAGRLGGVCYADLVILSQP